MTDPHPDLEEAERRRLFGALLEAIDPAPDDDDDLGRVLNTFFYAAALDLLESRSNTIPPRLRAQLDDYAAIASLPNHEKG